MDYLNRLKHELYDYVQEHNDTPKKILISYKFFNIMRVEHPEMEFPESHLCGIVYDVENGLENDFEFVGRE